ncbi:hypothetical protein Nepgr_010151 [Nepenthes gracilis]|uniref:Uncharacterized protein n=1 Tax=Nepenthes gracilis TaxID=150966 RepID=A0AAD3XL37_NEPGR|nr:hypothetical protein Nepgr_010151 [Nepenthes gracilis]
MLNRLLGQRGVAQIKRAMRNGKITFLCLVMTVVVLRGMIGAGHFGTPEQDVVLLRSHLSNNRRVFEEVNQSSSSSSGGTAAKKAEKNANSYEAFDINRILEDE